MAVKKKDNIIIDGTQMKLSGMVQRLGTYNRKKKYKFTYQQNNK